MIEQGVPMTKVAILATVWLHLIVVGALVEMDSIRIWKLPAPRIETPDHGLPVVELVAPPADLGMPGGSD
jgi:hypothetical protein